MNVMITHRHLFIFLGCFIVAGLFFSLNRSYEEPSNISGDWLSLRHAQKTRNLSQQIHYHLKKAYKEPSLFNITDAFALTLRAGEFKMSERLALKVRETPALWQQLRTHIRHDEDGSLTHLLTFLIIYDLKNHQLHHLSSYLELLKESVRSSANFSRRMQLWCEFAQGNVKRALELAHEDSQDGERLLMLALLKDMMSAPINQTQRLYANARELDKEDYVAILLHANYLMRHNRWDDAARLFKNLGNHNREIVLVARQGLNWAEHHRKVEPMIDDALGGIALALYRNGLDDDLFLDNKASIFQHIGWLRLATFSDESFAPSLLVSSIFLTRLYYTVQSFDITGQLIKNPLWRPFGLYKRALILHDNDYSRKAENLLRRALLEIPNERFVYGVLGDILIDTHHYEEALIAFDNAIVEVDDFDRLGDYTPQEEQKLLARYYYGRAIALHNIERFDESEESLEMAISFEGDNPYMLNYLAYSWIERDKELPRALAMLERAQQLEPDNGNIIDSYGWGLYKSGDIKGAVTHLEEAARHLPFDPTINDHLGDALWLSGRKFEAIYHWQRALKALKKSQDPLLWQSVKQKLNDPLQRPQKTNESALMFP